MFGNRGVAVKLRADPCLVKSHLVAGINDHSDVCFRLVCHIPDVENTSHPKQHC